jgi:large subunit ribosomal protein L13
MTVIDGNGMIFGRLASRIAKKVLSGEEVQLINAERMVISGDPKSLTKKFQMRRLAQNKGTPEHSPHWPRVPHMLVKRMLRGMLPWKSARGRAAYKKLMVYSGNPKNLVPGAALENPERKKGAKSMTILQLSKMLGYSG